MSKFFTSFFLISVFLILNGGNVKSESLNEPTSGISLKKIFIKTKTEFKISEATGEITLQTGVSSFDKKIRVNKVEKVKRVFRLNNGRKDLYEKFEMNRIYVLYFKIGRAHV